MKYFDNVLKNLAAVRREVLAAKKAAKAELKATKKAAKAAAKKAKPAKRVSAAIRGKNTKAVKAPKATKAVKVAKAPKAGKRGGLVRGSAEWKAAEAARIRAWRAKKKAEKEAAAKPVVKPAAPVAKPVPPAPPAPPVEPPAPEAPRPVSPLDFSGAPAPRPAAKPSVMDRVTLSVYGIGYEHDSDEEVPEDLPDTLTVLVDGHTASEALDPSDPDYTNLLMHVESALDDKGIDVVKHRPVTIENVERVSGG